MKKILVLILLIIFSFESILAQKNNLEAALYNIGIGSIISTCGAIINKKKEEKYISVIGKGLWQGGLGGYITFESKRILNPAYVHEDWKLYWSSKILNAAGTSIKENAALNRNFWEQWNLNIGFVRLEFHTKDRFYFNAKILPFSTIYTIGAAFQTDFELKNSLITGQLVFSSDSPLFDSTNSVGVTYIGLMVIKKGYTNNYQLYSHEIIHIYQQNDCLAFNSFYNKPFNSFVREHNIVNKISTLVYLDLHSFIPYSVNLYENNHRIYYYDNFLEHEAGYYSNTLMFNYKVK